MLGAIIGDTIGSVYEFMNRRSTDFPLFSEKTMFTDDTVLTVAIADAFMNKKDYAKTLREYSRKHPLAGYGGTYIMWIDCENMGPYNSWGNGSAMRVSSIGWLCDTLEETLEESKKSAEVTHNHIEGIKGAQSVASAIFLARNGSTKEEIKEYITETFGYNLDRTIDEIRPTYEFCESCQGSVPEAIIAFLESNDFEDCIRIAISLGGDSDTIAAIAGGIAEAFYKEIPDEMSMGVLEIVSNNSEFIPILKQFYELKKC